MILKEAKITCTDAESVKQKGKRLINSTLMWTISLLKDTLKRGKATPRMETPLGLVHWKRASSPVEAGTAGYL